MSNPFQITGHALPGEPSSGTADAPLEFVASPTGEARPDGADVPWRILIVDDDPAVHAVSRLVLADVAFKGRGLEILSEYSAAGARRLLRSERGIAVVLLDVVMETASAGLDLVDFIRSDIGDRLVRIVMRTGQPGHWPEQRIVTEYDVNDYKEKTELTAQKLVTTVTAALRTYDDMVTIQRLASSNEALESMVRCRTAELERANVVLREAEALARIGHFELDGDTFAMTWSDGLLAIAGDPCPGGLRTFGDFLERVSPRDRADVDRAVRRALAERSPYALEHDIVRPDGSTTRVVQQGEIRGELPGGGPRLLGIVHDVTEYRAVADSMRRLSTAIEHTADLVMITDLAGIIEYVNPAFTAATGYTRDDVTGRTPALLKSGEHAESFFQEMWHRVLDGGVFSGVFINRRKDGTLFHESKTISPAQDQDGRITHLISTGRDVTESVLAQRRIEHLAHHDALSGLPNRALLQDRLNQAIARARWHGRRVVVLFVDLDRFKVVNDTLGHATGDRLLQAIAVRLTASVREGDTVARLGGDEFAVLLNDVAAADDIPVIAHKILDELRAPIGIDGRELFVTASIGASLFPDHGDDSAALIRRADIAMYGAKATGKNRFEIYTTRDEATELERLALETDLRRALSRNEFHLVYQPQVRVATGEICGIEALLRWRHPRGHLVPPADFIPLLEEMGTIGEVGAWILRTACAEAMSLRQAGMTGIRVAVNISLAQFRQTDFVETVSALLHETGLDPEGLEIEITENLLIDDIQGAASVLRDLRRIGVRLALDDFGTGYSSMHHLRQLSFNTLKIDRSFVRALPASTDDAAIVKAIASLARSMNMEVVAEGVETPEQLRFVAWQGCDAIQGFLFSEPLRGGELADLARTGRLPRLSPAGADDA